MSELGAALLAQLDERDLDELATMLERRASANAPEPVSGSLLSPRQVADRLGVSAETVRRAARAGRLEACWVGTEIRIAPAAVEAWTTPASPEAMPAHRTRRRTAGRRSPMRDALRAL